MLLMIILMILKKESLKVILKQFSYIYCFSNGGYALVLIKV